MKRALVTGGGTGIGRSIAAALRTAGLDVVLVGRRQAVLEQAARDLDATWIAGDVVTDCDAILDTAGPLDVLVNNAGHADRAPIEGWTAEHFHSLYAVHTVAPALLSRGFAKRCAGPGRIVHIASTLAKRPAPCTAAYAAAKAGMLALSRALALELAPRGITSNALLPGIVPTAMNAGRMDALVPLHPLGRLGTGTDVADAVVWLVQAPWVTGAEIPVDGGLLIRE
jgi:3-oxoacyl-[acyl-carrier protein] reductase